MTDSPPHTNTADRRVFRNARFQVLSVVTGLLAAGFGVLIYIVVTSPGQSLDHPGGFTSGGRVLAAIGCVIAAVTFGVYSVGSARVALVIDQSGLLIRNPFRTTNVSWESGPRLGVRDRSQDVEIISDRPNGPWAKGRMTYRYREITCTVGRRQIWIAATSRMTRRHRVEDKLAELRDACAAFTPKMVVRSESSRTKTE